MKEYIDPFTGSKNQCNISNIHFGEDGEYDAYECFGDVEIGEHYKKVFEGEHWLRIYDDEKATYYKNGREFETEYKKVDIYRDGDFGCIIHWHN